MRPLLLAFVVLFPVFCFSQQTQIYYSFSVVGVKTLSDAKPVAESMFHLFDIMPKFNEQNKQFEFSSPVNINEQKLALKIKNYNYQIVNFRKSIEPPAKE